MFEQPTVFILGAGASWHYGYPTGEDLVKKVQEKARLLIKYLSFEKVKPFAGVDRKYFPNFIVHQLHDKELVKIDVNEIDRVFTKFSKDCEEIINRLSIVNPPVIDYFLRDNPELQLVGKILIAMAIKGCELSQKGKKHNQNRHETEIKKLESEGKEPKDDWLRFVIHQLLTPEQRKTVNPEHHLLKNKVTFITFNYDTSLEDKLYQALSKTEVTKKNCTDFFSEERFIHIYGKVNSDNNKNIKDKELGCNILSSFLETIQKLYSSNTNVTNIDRELLPIKNFLDACYSADIKTISEVNKHENEDAIKAARDAIKNAKNVYILGYGFDEQNSILLELYTLNHALEEFPEVLYNSKRIMFTNFGDSNRINKKASTLFFADEESDKNILSESGKFVLEGDTGSRQHGDHSFYYYEKSTRNVYDAFAYDFDAI